MITIKDTTYKGTRILLGNNKRNILNQIIELLKKENFEEISIPIIQYQEMFKNKIGKENNNLMFNLKDKKNRELCLAPEYTAIIQELSKTYFKTQKNVNVFYIQECFRGERQQKGRYRQFTQLGVEIINPKDDYLLYITNLAEKIINIFGVYSYEVNKNVKRGLDYYEEESGFEIKYTQGDSAKQICGGGRYEGGVGFAIGIDRLLDI